LRSDFSPRLETLRRQVIQAARCKQAAPREIFLAIIYWQLRISIKPHTQPPILIVVFRQGHRLAIPGAGAL